MDKYGLVLDCFDPMQLHWVGTSWKEYPFRNIDLNRGDYEYLDLLVAQANNMHIYITGDQFPCARYEQRAIPTTLSIGKYILKVTLYGDDVEPKTVYISLV